MELKVVQIVAIARGSGFVRRQERIAPVLKVNFHASRRLTNHSVLKVFTDR
jgi:hypothetical protein